MRIFSISYRLWQQTKIQASSERVYEQPTLARKKSAEKMALNWNVFFRAKVNFVSNSYVLQPSFWMSNIKREEEKICMQNNFWAFNGTTLKINFVCSILFSCIYYYFSCALHTRCNDCTSFLKIITCKWDLFRTVKCTQRESIRYDGIAHIVFIRKQT